jgi:methyl-accepting chemotaxis protein
MIWLRQEMTRRALHAGLSLLALALAVVVAGCGSSKPSVQEQTNNWANGACSALVTWKDSITAAGQSVKNNLTKSSIQSASQDVQSANSKLSDDLKGLGKPPTPGADQAKSSLQQFSDQVKTGTDQIKQAISGITNASSVATAVTAIGSTVQTVGTELQSTVTDMKNIASDDTWKKAFQDSDSCKKLTSSS